MRRKDEYNKIYEQNGDFGFEFRYKNGSLGKVKNIYPNQIRKIETSKHNEDEVIMVVKCGECNIYMDFIHSIRGPLTGKWICPNCGTHVRESTVYNKLDKMNESFQLIDDNDYDDIW